jgi:hypothetical protein
MLNSLRQKLLLISSTHEISSEPADISRNKSQESMGQRNWSTFKPNLANAESMRLIVNQAAEAEDGVAMAAEADTEAGDVKAKEAKILDEPISME